MKNFFIYLAILMTTSTTTSAKDLVDNFNVEYISPSACEISLQQSNSNIEFVDFYTQIAGQNNIIIRCSKSLSYSISHIPSNTPTLNPHHGVLTGLNTDESIDYIIKVLEDNGNSHTLSPTNKIDLIGDGKERNIPIEIRRIYTSKVPSVDTYTAISTIKVTF